MKKITKTVVLTAMFVMLAGTVVQARPQSCQNACTMNGSSCYMQECPQICVKKGCDNTVCQNSKYCENHKVKRVEPKKNTWGNHGHHGHHEHHRK